jgi:hypothetical protein
MSAQRNSPPEKIKVARKDADYVEEWKLARKQGLFVTSICEQICRHLVGRWAQISQIYSASVIYWQIKEGCGDLTYFLQAVGYCIVSSARDSNA